MSWPEYPYQTQMEYMVDERGEPLAYREVAHPTGEFFPNRATTDIFARVGTDPVSPNWGYIRGLLLAASIPPDEIPKLDIAAITGILNGLPASERKADEREAPVESTPKTSKPRLSKKDVQAVVRAALLHHHEYEDGEIGESSPLAAKAIVDRITAETGATEKAAKSAVSRAFGSLFGDGGHTTYRNYCSSEKLLLNWCLQQADDGKAFAVGTLDAGELASESELQSRVAFRE